MRKVLVSFYTGNSFGHVVAETNHKINEIFLSEILENLCEETQCNEVIIINIIPMEE